jgi:hypothetical protein
MSKILIVQFLSFGILYIDKKAVSVSWFAVSMTKVQYVENQSFDTITKMLNLSDLFVLGK